MVIDDTSFRSQVVRAMAGGSRAAAGAPSPVELRKATVASVDGGVARCLMDGDASALTPVHPAGHTLSVGSRVVAVGQGGRWYVVGTLD